MAQGETPACIYCPCYIGRACIQLYWVVATNIASISMYNLFAEYNPRRNHDLTNGRCGHTSAGDAKEKCGSGHFLLALKDTSKDERWRRRDRLALENKQCMIYQADRLGWLWRSLSRPTGQNIAKVAHRVPTRATIDQSPLRATAKPADKKRPLLHGLHPVTRGGCNSWPSCLCSFLLSEALAIRDRARAGPNAGGSRLHWGDYMGKQRRAEMMERMQGLREPLERMLDSRISRLLS
jgi:hypothetical protein